MKKYLLAVLMVMPIALYAEGESKGPKGPKGGFNFMEKLTDEQKACVEEQGCPKHERPDRKDGEKPEKPKDMTDEEKAAMKESRECMKKAFETCGVEMPKKDGKKGPRGEFGEKPEKSE